MSDASVVSGIIAADALQQYIEVMTPLVFEAKIHFGDDGIHSAVVDPANVATHDAVELDAEAFESYDAPGSATIGVNLNRLDDILDVAGSGDLVELSVDMETRHLGLQFDGVEQSVAMIDPDAIRQEPDRPDLDLPNMAVIEGRDLDRALTIAELNSDHVDVVADPDAEDVLSFEAQGDTDSGRVGFGVEDCIGTQVVEATASVFSLDYLVAFADPIDDDTEVELWFRDEFPMRLSWGGAGGDLSVSSLLAPRIQSR